MSSTMKLNDYYYYSFFLNNDSRSLLQTIANFEFGNFVSKSRSKLGVNGRVDVDTVGTDACLPASSEFANNSSCANQGW